MARRSQLAHFGRSVNLLEVNRKTPLELTMVCRAGKQFNSYLLTHLPKAHALLNTRLRELSLALVGDARMADLHVKFLGIPGPTDVLTFPLEQDAAGRDIAGEVVVCVPEARRQAVRNGNTVQQEVLLYALHGILHLSGFDDRTPDGFREMHRKEDEILQMLGIGRLFSKAQPGLLAESHLNAKTTRSTRLIRRAAGDS